MTSAWRNFKNIFLTWPKWPVGANILLRFQFEGKTDVWISQVRRVDRILFSTQDLSSPDSCLKNWSFKSQGFVMSFNHFNSILVWLWHLFKLTLHGSKSIWKRNLDCFKMVLTLRVCESNLRIKHKSLVYGIHIAKINFDSSWIDQILKFDIISFTAYDRRMVQQDFLYVT